MQTEVDGPRLLEMLERGYPVGGPPLQMLLSPSGIVVPDRWIFRKSGFFYRLRKGVSFSFLIPAFSPSSCLRHGYSPLQSHLQSERDHDSYRAHSRKAPNPD